MVRPQSLPSSFSVLLSSWLIALLLVANVPAAVQDGDGGGGGGDLEYTQEEIDLLPKFRVIVKDLLYMDYMSKDEYLVRWLRKCDHSLQRAQDALKEALEWRKSNGIDHILEEDMSDLDKELTLGFEGTDKGGRPIAIINLGSVDVRKVVLGGHGKRVTRMLLQCFELAENVLREMRTQGSKNVTRAFFIIDINGFNIRQHACPQCLPIIVNLFRAYESYYPDLGYKAYALNTPRAFLPFYELIRPFFSELTRRAVQVFDSHADRWKEALRNDVDADQLPIVYGGTRVVHAKSISALRKTNPFIKAVYERAEAANQQNKPE